MAYSFGHIEVCTGSKKKQWKQKKKHGYSKKVRAAMKNEDFVPFKYKGYQ